MTNRGAWLVLGVLGALGAPKALAAQVVEVQLRQEGSRAPVAGAIVRLLGESGVLGMALSNEQGRVTLRAPGPGSFRIKVDRIGWTGLISEPFPGAAGEQIRKELLMSATRMELPTVIVRGKSQCGLSGQGGTPAAALWEEIRKALTANLLTARQGATPLFVREFLREVDRGGRRLREWAVRAALVRGQPFGSLPPARLARDGFMIADAADSVLFAAPDAALLLSDEFVATHCFRAVPGEGGLVGLAFEPTSNRQVTEVRGTIWVDRATSQLRYLEYKYTHLGGLLGRADLGGRVEFQQLPSGAWIVGYWHIRTPKLGNTVIRATGNVQRLEAYLTGYLDLGGRAEVAVDTLGRIDRALVTGRIYDSIGGTGLSGAMVRIREGGDSVETDASGQFFLAVQASGDQMVEARHPRVGLLNYPARQAALLSIGDTTSVDFVVPSVGGVVRSLCGNTPRGRSGIVGMAWGPGAGGVPSEGIELRITWKTSTGGQREERSRSGARGLFAFCDLPADRPYTVRMVNGIMTLGEATVELGWGAFEWVDLHGERGSERP